MESSNIENYRENSPENNIDINSDYLYDNLEEHQINQTDFTKPTSTSFQMVNRSADPYKDGVNKGNIVVETPLSFLLKRYYMKNISCYICHKRIFLNGCTNDTNYIFLTDEDILITSEYDEEYNNEENKTKVAINNVELNRRFSKVNPILMRIEYRQVNFK